MYTANEMLEIAKNELEYLNPQEEFLVRDLFKGYIWNRQDISVRLTLGTLFISFAQESEGVIEVLRKSPSGQQKYKRR